LCCRICIEFVIFLSARTQRKSGELRAVKKALRTTQGFFFAIKWFFCTLPSSAWKDLAILKF
ncbi:MAG: hypothetical protein ACLRMI_04065, partial [Streptococcus sp.]